MFVCDLFSLMDAAKNDEDDSSDHELLVPRRRTPLEQVGEKLELSYSEITATTQIYDQDRVNVWHSQKWF
jgi:hypothetical protein